MAGHARALQGRCRKPARTLDGQLIRVEANIGMQEDVELALDNGADGVGLLRIEQLYFARQIPPTEDELFLDLQKLVTPLGDRPVTDSSARYRRRQAAAVSAACADLQSGAGAAGRARIAGILATGPHANGGHFAAFAGTSGARADSDGHARRRHVERNARSCSKLQSPKVKSPILPNSAR